MRRPSLATIASYGTVLGVNAAEGVTQLLIPPYLEQRDYPIVLIGFLFALPYGVALVCRVPAGLVYRGSRARLLVGGAAVLAALVALLYPHASGPLAFGALRATQGVAVAMVTTVTLAHFMATVASGAARGRAMGYYVSALSAGFMIGGAIGGPVAEWWGYETGFAIAAALALGTAVLGYWLPRAQEAGPPLGVPRGGLTGLRRALGDPGLLYASGVAFLLTCMYHVPGAFFPLYGLSVGLGLGEIGIIRAAFAFVNTTVRGLSASVLDRVGVRPAVAVGLTCHAVALAFVPSFGQFLPLLVLLLFVAFWRAVVIVGSTVVLAEQVDPRRVSRGVAAGVYNAAGDLAGIVAPALGGLVAAGLGLDNLFRVLPLLALGCYFALVVWIRPPAALVATGAPAERSP
jgi:predicted MFS family arabinose efflux permease